MKYLTIILLSFWILNLNAQSIEKQVIGSAGNINTSGSITLSATLGELCVETITGSFVLSQGYHQGIEDITIDLKEIDIKLDYTLYPNPSTDFVCLDLNASENVRASINIYNATGKNVSDIKKIAGMKTKTIFDISSLPNGIYYVNIVFENKESKTISFLKK